MADRVRRSGSFTASASRSRCASRCSSPGAHLATSLVSFNVGVELGQIFVLALAVPALALVFKHVVAERMGTIILSAFVAHTAWHWMLDRGALLSQYNVQLPAFDAAFLVSVLRGLMLLLVVVGGGVGACSSSTGGWFAARQSPIRGSRPAPTRTDASHVYEEQVDDGLSGVHAFLRQADRASTRKRRRPTTKPAAAGEGARPGRPP